MLPFDFNFTPSDADDLFLLSQRALPRHMLGLGRPGMINFYLNYSTPVTVANTTTETSLLGAPDAGSTKTILAADARVGMTFWLHFAGILAATGAATLNLRLKLGTTTLETYTPTLPAIAGTAWVLDIFAVIRAVGAGGAIDVEAGAFAFALNVQGATQWSGRDTANTPVDFSVNKDWALTAQWSAAAPGDSFSYRFGCVNIVR